MINAPSMCWVWYMYTGLTQRHTYRPLYRDLSLLHNNAYCRLSHLYYANTCNADARVCDDHYRRRVTGYEWSVSIEPRQADRPTLAVSSIVADDLLQLYRPGVGLGRWYVCWLHRGNCLLVRAVDGCMMHCDTISSRQWSATTEIVKRF